MAPIFIGRYASQTSFREQGANCRRGKSNRLYLRRIRSKLRRIGKERALRGRYSQLAQARSVLANIVAFFVWRDARTGAWARQRGFRTLPPVIFIFL